MKLLLTRLWLRFKSQVPPAVKKIQVLLALASASLTPAPAITWPAGLTIVGTCCSYAAAICAFAVILLQFTQQAIQVFEPETGVEPADKN